MFKRNSGKSRKAPRIDTLIGVGTRVLGDVEFTGGLHVDGAIRGDVYSPDDGHGRLTISDSGVIEGSVRVPIVVLNGAVHGDIDAHERVQLGATARVAGNVYYTVIEMAIGAEINGKLIHRSTVSARTSAAAQIPAEDVPLSDHEAHQMLIRSERDS
jgi:cytoskeletal protein CcmA (bactofilin family)